MRYVIEICHDGSKSLYLEDLTGAGGLCLGTHRVESALTFRKRHLAEDYLRENEKLLTTDARVKMIEVPERAVQQPKNLETRGD